MSWLARLWRFLHELSGEAAIARRMAVCDCASATEAYTRAVDEQYGGVHRCC